MVNMGEYEMTPEGVSIRDKVKQLREKRSDMENEYKEHMDILAANNTNRTEPLVDAEGFPRNDIDVFQVRHARHKIIYLINDLKSITEEINKNLQLFHSGWRRYSGTTDQIQASPQEPSTPIARIGNVVPNSPADKAGLVKNDFILKFGSVNSSNFVNLQDIAAIVKSSVNSDVLLRVLRNGVQHNLSLKPQPFDGQGLVGCYFLNVENVER